ncbi:MAG: hypothetical protein HUK03_08135, partial [Bacteroidaceae bacterium]|nr:hypothetical protein [Bacteroidaceae bacterium]
DVYDYLVSRNIYPDAKRNKDYRSEDNLLNQFVTYHFLPAKLSVNNLIYHYNELRYPKPKGSETPTPTVSMSEFYTTMGKRRLIRIYESRKTSQEAAANETGVFLNRFPVLYNGRKDDYTEQSCAPANEGIAICKSDVSGENDMINGIIYPINKVLLYDDNTRDNLFRTRIRWDVSAMLPELINNNIRGMNQYGQRTFNTSNISNAVCGIAIPDDTQYRYFNDLSIARESYFVYWAARDWGWTNYQGDEINITGSVEVTFRMPPVPRKGTYELRFACQNGGEMGNRGIFQFYWGKDPDNLAAVDIPLNMMIGGTEVRTPQGAYPSGIGWVEDDPFNMDINEINDKQMRLKGFMKGANIYCAGSPQASGTGRTSSITSRRIIVRKEMDPNDTYYLRFRACLDDDLREFYLDYMEYCPKEVYDNPETPEDIW